MKHIAKTINILMLCLLLTSCSHRTYTKNKYWSCLGPLDAVLDKDKQQLIYKILERAVVKEKDIPDYHLLKDKNRIYISKEYVDRFFEESEIYHLGNGDIPKKINGVSFSLKSPEELQAIADETEPFTFLVFGNISINGNTAVVGIDHWWQRQTNENLVIMSGGGYILEYQKTGGEWQFKKIIRRFQS